MNIGLVLALIVLVPTALFWLFIASQIRPDLNPRKLEAKYATPPSRFVEAAGYRFHIRDRGTGPVLLLVHGQSANLFTWEGWAAQLADSFRVISVDLPGHGLTGPDPGDRYSWTQMAAALDALMETLGISRFVLVGNSLGGAVSTTYALSYQQKLDALVLIDCIGAPRAELKPAAFELYTKPFIGKALTVLTPLWTVRGSLGSLYGDPARLSEADVRLTFDMLRRKGNRPAQHKVVAIDESANIAAHVSEITVPVLIMWGRRDTWVLPKYADWFTARLPQAKLIWYDALGHTPMEEDPATTARDLRNFLAGLNIPPAA